MIDKFDIYMYFLLWICAICILTGLAYLAEYIIFKLFANEELDSPNTENKQ